MKSRITPIGIISIFVVVIMAQTGIYSAQPAMAASAASWQQQDTIPKHHKDSMKKKHKDWPKKDTTNKPRKDTFPATARR